MAHEERESNVINTCTLMVNHTPIHPSLITDELGVFFHASSGTFASLERTSRLMYISLDFAAPIYKPLSR